MLGSAVLAAAVLWAMPASACWDGVAARGRGVHVSLAQDASWNPATARQMALWITRLEALVPADTDIVITNGIHCEEAACPEGALLEVPDGDLARAFDATATIFGVAPAVARRAKSLPASLYTVQVFAGAERGARAARERIHALRDDEPLDIGGFYTEGRYRAVHPIAHILRDGTDRGSPFRVVVGAHRARSEADAAVAQLRAHGVAAFVRTMPDQPTFDEPVSSPGR